VRYKRTRSSSSRSTRSLGKTTFLLLLSLGNFENPRTGGHGLDTSAIPGWEPDAYDTGLVKTANLRVDLENVHASSCSAGPKSGLKATFRAKVRIFRPEVRTK